MLDLRTQYEVRYTIQDAKSKIVLMFMEQIIAIASEEGFSLEQILEALAEYTSSHPRYKKAERHLNLAAEAVKRV